jgi:hypothetical protein
MNSSRLYGARDKNSGDTSITLIKEARIGWAVNGRPTKYAVTTEKTVNNIVVAGKRMMDDILHGTSHKIGFE